MEARTAIAALGLAAALAAGAALAEAALEPLPASAATFTPQYPLWSDGATKRRWISLPEGAAIDGSRPAAWEFPVGTKLRKEFSVGARRVETRTIEHLADGSWQFRAYVWNDAQDAATLAPAAGTIVTLADGTRYRIPSQDDCRACHEGGAAPVLGFNALQLSPDRDPLAPHAEPPRPGDLDLRALAASGKLAAFPRELIETPPRIVAPTPAGRAALGYLHANCGHCHADPKFTNGAVPVELQLAIDPTDPRSAEGVLQTLLTSESRYRPAGAADARLIVPGNAQAGTLPARMRSRDPRIQMPPLGTAKPDLTAIALIARWIHEDLKTPEETSP
ncbi:MAG: hypothetical protein KF822_07565 [Steroidobacteraceae bacterium]|nr:hypothetical protein [Steroidobacteraceae bacterium]